MATATSDRCVGHSAMAAKQRRRFGGGIVVHMLPGSLWVREEVAQACREGARSIRSMSSVLSIRRDCIVRLTLKLHRHTARYPTTDGGGRLLKSLAKLRDRGIHLPRRHPELAFLGTANYDLRGWEFDGLMNQGRKA